MLILLTSTSILDHAPSHVAPITPAPTFLSPQHPAFYSIPNQHPTLPYQHLLVPHPGVAQSLGHLGNSLKAPGWKKAAKIEYIISI